MISALFDWQGKRLVGDERVAINLCTDHNDAAPQPSVWWYLIEPLDDYQFIRVPVNPGAVIESLGTLGEEKNARAEYFRYVAVPDGRIRGGTPPNVKVNFMVFAYRPSDLLTVSKGHIH